MGANANISRSDSIQHSVSQELLTTGGEKKTVQAAVALHARKWQPSLITISLAEVAPC